MSVIVKSTPEAIEAITRMRSVVDSGLVQQIQALNGEGARLMDTNNWAGPKADEFRQVWPDTHRHLQTVREDLVRLSEQLRAIQQNIQTAGA
ncbi:MAG: pyrophosphorylase [Acidimicrobiia bacterium]|nr:pyrophosphorylase [Acidimicrobiia bacterium]